MAEPIPEAVTKEHVLQAIRLLDEGHSHRFGTSTIYEMHFNGRIYAPKAAIGVALEVAFGRQFGPYDFYSGEDRTKAVGRLRELGFDVRRKVDAPAAAYLFSWNPAKWPWDKFLALHRQWSEDPNMIDVWHAANNKSIPSGARAFLVQQGTDGRGIIGSGWTTSGLKRTEHYDGSGRMRNSNELWFDVLLNPKVDRILDVSEISDLGTKIWGTQSSGIIIPDDVAAALEDRWARLLSETGRFRIDPGSAIDPSAIPASSEGRRLLRMHLAAERNPGIVRDKKETVLRTTGRLICEGCGFDFVITYGERGIGFCECHHTVPLSDGERITRVDDLAIVCSNCHRMIHRKDPMLGMDELRELVKRQIELGTNAAQ